MEIVEGFIISVEVVITCCLKLFEMFWFRGVWGFRLILRVSLEGSRILLTIFPVRTSSFYYDEFFNVAKIQYTLPSKSSDSSQIGTLRSIWAGQKHSIFLMHLKFIN